MDWASENFQYWVKRHEARAQKHIANGNTEWAAGSMRKAAKWRQKQREWDNAMYGKHPKPVLESIYDQVMGDMVGRLQRQIERRLIYGE